MSICTILFILIAALLIKKIYDKYCMPYEGYTNLTCAYKSPFLTDNLPWGSVAERREFLHIIEKESLKNSPVSPWF